MAHFGRVRSYANIMLPSSHGWNVPAGRVADAMFEGVNANVTAITLAALGGWPNAVTTLLDLGVSPNVGRQCGAKAVTPFMVALLQSQTSLVRSLAYLLQLKHQLRLSIHYQPLRGAPINAIDTQYAYR